MKCPKCGAVLQAMEGNCPQCGVKYTVRRVEKPGKRCPACGQNAPADAKRCPGCGRPFQTQKLKSPFTGLFIGLTIALSVIVAGCAGFLIWYFFL